MWICLNNAFFSIVASDRDPAVLAVRTRREGDLEKYFTGHEVHHWRGRDYAFRAFIPRDAVAKVIAASIEATNYTNFKSSVDDAFLHDAYVDFWAIMSNLQRRLQKSNRRFPWIRPPRD